MSRHDHETKAEEEIVAIDQDLEQVRRERRFLNADIHRAAETGRANGCRMP